MSEVTPSASIFRSDGYRVAHQFGALKASESLGLQPPTVELGANLEALEARISSVGPQDALEGFLIGLGSLEPPVNVVIPLPEPGQRARAEALQNVWNARTSAQAAAEAWADELAASSGRVYRHSMLPRLVADMLGVIFAERRDPGHLLDEAIASRFDVSGRSVDLDDLWRVAANARERISSSSDLMHLVERLVAAAVSSDVPYAAGSALLIAKQLVGVVFSDDVPHDDATRIATGMFVGGLLGAICLSPFRNRFATDRLVDVWSDDELDDARNWASQMANPITGVTRLRMWGNLKSLDPIRNIGWPPSTDFLMQLGVLSKGFWFYEPDGEESGLQTFIAEQVRVGSMLAVWRSGGRYEVGPDKATGPDALRHHNFGRGQNRTARWDLSVSLNALSEAGHSAFRSVEAAVPHPELITCAIEDALALHQWELAESLASLLLLHLFVTASRDYPDWLPFDLLVRQRQMQPRELGYVGPTIRYLLRLSRTAEYSGHEWVEDLEKLADLFIAGDSDSLDPIAITHSAARSELVSLLVGPVFLQLPPGVKSKLVEVVLRRKRLAADIDSGKLRHFGADTVSLVNPLESLLRERLSALSDSSLRILSNGTVNSLEVGEHSKFTLGPMVIALKKFAEYPHVLQEQLRSMFPCLPLSRAQRERLFRLTHLRNEGAHTDLSRAQYEEAWNLLFSTSYNDAIEKPAIYALLGNTLGGRRTAKLRAK